LAKLSLSSNSKRTSIRFALVYLAMSLLTHACAISKIYCLTVDYIETQFKFSEQTILVDH